MTIYLLVTNDCFELPVDFAEHLSTLSSRWKIPLKTLQNRLCDSKPLLGGKYRVERVILEADR